MEIDRRVRAKEFMSLLSMKKDAFYDRIKVVISSNLSELIERMFSGMNHM